MMIVVINITHHSFWDQRAQGCLFEDEFLWDVSWSFLGIFGDSGNHIHQQNDCTIDVGFFFVEQQV